LNNQLQVKIMAKFKTGISLHDSGQKARLFNGSARSS